MKSVIFLVLLCCSNLVFSEVESEIKNIVLKNLQYTQSEDVNKILSTVHSQSPNYLATKQVFNQLFPVYDLKYTLVDYRFIGEEGGYAYAKVVQLTEKISGGAFQNNKLEALQVFKKENGLWKLWAQANLSIIYI